MDMQSRIRQLFQASIDTKQQAMVADINRNLSQIPSMANPELISGTGLHWGVVAAIFVVIAAYIMLQRHIRQQLVRPFRQWR